MLARQIKSNNATPPAPPTPRLPLVTSCLLGRFFWGHDFRFRNHYTISVCNTDQNTEYSIPYFIPNRPKYAFIFGFKTCTPITCKEEVYNWSRLNAFDVNLMNKSKYSTPCKGQLRRTCMETLNLLIASIVSRSLQCRFMWLSISWLLANFVFSVTREYT